MAVMNRLNYTLECIKSFNQQSYKDKKIIIFNSGSTDGTKEIIAQKYPDIKMFTGTTDIWDSQGLSTCIDYVKSIAKKGDFVLIQNNDAIMDKDFVKTLIAVSEKYNRSVVGAINKSKTTGKVIYHVPILKNGVYRPALLSGEVPEVIENAPTLPTRGTIFPIEVFDKIGNFSKLFPHYAGDYDLTCRAKEAGWKLLVSTKAISYSQDDNKNTAWKLKHKEKKTLKDVFTLFTSRRSSASLYYSTLFVILHVPFPHKIVGVFRIWAYAVKFFFFDYLFNSVIKGK